jgi:spore coat polysaccharide biosynthesis protein SpsF
MAMKILIVVQARTGSTRLPNKIMMPLAGKPLLQRMIERVRAAKTNFDLVVATTSDKSDDIVRDLCKELGYDCYRGHPTDLLDRHYRAAIERKANVVVKIPSDCPLIDPAVIDRVLAYSIQHHDKFDYVGNLHPPSYPDGNDVEVMTLDALGVAWREATRDFEREHTTPFIWDNPDRFRIGCVAWETGLNFSMSHRWTIDYQEDYQFIDAVYDELWNEAKSIFTMQDILGLLSVRPDIYEINAKFAGVNWYRHHLDELKTVSAGQTRQLT